MIRLAASFPPAHPKRVAILARLAGQDTSIKVASSAETEIFIQWALKKGETMSANEVNTFLEQKLGREAEKPVEGAAPTRNTGPLRKGETVLVNARENTNPSNTDACEQYHNRVGMIEDLSSEGLTVAFYRGDNEHPSTDLSGDKQFFSGTASGKKTGLYRWTPKPVYQGGIEKKTMFEAVYLRAGEQVDVRSREQIQQYIEKGQNVGEDRSDIYYSGPVGKFAIGKNGLYFQMSVQQRDRPTSFNPTDGKLLYLGTLGKRPGGWLGDAKKMGLV